MLFRKYSSKFVPDLAPGNMPGAAHNCYCLCSREIFPHVGTAVYEDGHFFCSDLYEIQMEIAKRVAYKEK